MISSGLILHICVFAIVAQKPEEPMKLLNLSKKDVNEKMSIIRQSLAIGSTHNIGRLCTLLIPKSYSVELYKF